MKTALILNFTGNTYHYGCYGTSFEIYHQLLEKGYAVNFSSVRVTHGLPLFPESAQVFLDQQFANEFLSKNAGLTFNMGEADIIVVNGEGTLHRASRGSFSLLYLIFLSTQILKKPAYLINHSVFPNGDTSKDTPLDVFYEKVLTGVTGVAVRDTLSAKFYKWAKIKFTQSFDSLPLYFKRQNLFDVRKQGFDQDKILLCGGINYSADKIKVIANLLKQQQGKKIEFLLGGKDHLAPEEEIIFSRLVEAGLDITLIKASSFEQWTKTIAGASMLISGRFHYTIAALALGVPCIAFNSNTPKVEGIYDLLEHDGFLDWNTPDFESKLAAYIEQAQQGKLTLSEDKRALMLTKASKNFSIIPDA